MWVLVVLVAVVALPGIIGSLMPVRYEGQTVVEFDGSVEQVWEVLQDVEKHPMTGKMMKSLERLPPQDGRPAWKEDMGRGEIVNVVTTVYEPPQRMTRQMAATTVDMTSRWDYTLEQADERCRIRLSGLTDIEKGTARAPFFRFMMFVGGGVKKGLDIHLDMVAKTLQSEG